MEVGAVKQAFNNEVILLKKNLNQARIQIIHKLTRKAKTLAEKKAPEHLKEKNKKKAESAVNEVLIMKKLKPRDLASFIITHKGQLKQYLNKPQADKDKACARLLLHKALEQKYKLIKEKFGDVPIGDLLMSRQERRKLKKEQKEQQKNKKKGKDAKVVNSEGDWNVEEVGNKILDQKVQNDDERDDQSVDQATESDDQQNESDEQEDESDDQQELEEMSEAENIDQEESDKVKERNKKLDESDQDVEMDDSDVELDDDQFSDNSEKGFGTFVKLNKSPIVTKSKINVENQTKIDTNIKSKDMAPKNKSNKKIKDTKKLDDKILNRKFKKVNDESNVVQQKVVDPFFITETGENYLSVAEPRQPDEVKEVHKQGNRKLRRAIMFGHVPKIKPRQDRYNNDSSNYNNSQLRFNNSKFGNNDRFNNSDKFNNSGKFNNDRSNNSGKFNNDHSNNTGKFNNDRSNNSGKIDNDRFNNRNKFDNANDRKFNNNRNTEGKEEKLHPSWEAKKKQSGILPFQGKKIVFDES